MFCSDKDFKKLFTNGNIVIEKQTEEDIRTSSVDLRVSNIVSVLSPSDITINAESSFEDLKQTYKEVDITDNYYTLKPKESVIASTNKITLNGDYVGILVNRNSLIRLGVHISVSIINAGYSGILPLVVYNNSGFNFQFKAGDKLCQLIVGETGKIENPYYTRLDSKYQNCNTLISKYNQDR
jgi:deoxycytidine triphosphate deaminase